MRAGHQFSTNTDFSWHKAWIFGNFCTSYTSVSIKIWFLCLNSPAWAPHIDYKGILLITRVLVMLKKCYFFVYNLCSLEVLPWSVVLCFWIHALVFLWAAVWNSLKLWYNKWVVFLGWYCFAGLVLWFCS